MTPIPTNPSHIIPQDDRLESVTAQVASGVSTRGDKGHSQSEEQQNAEAASENIVGRPGGADGPHVDQIASVRAEQVRKLAELREWVRDQQEIEILEDVRRRYVLGDRSAIQSITITPNGATKPKTIQSRPNLPRPGPPHTYKKKNRADYDMWERDCESHYTQVASEFETEEQKVDFGIQYVSQTLKTLWEVYCQQQALICSEWKPTWEMLKQKMLDALGTPAERRQAAYNSLKRCKQRSGQSPTDLLAYLSRLWEEVGDYNPQRHVNEFVSALSELIRNNLFLLPVNQRETVPQVEEQANAIYRRLLKSNKIGNRKFRGSKRKQGPSEPSEDQRSPKRSKRGRRGQKRSAKGESQSNSPAIAQGSIKGNGGNTRRGYGRGNGRGRIKSGDAATYHSRHRVPRIG
ncbi:hypothetical protein K432DRAFT_424726 [Lepidopterella palustris CBS 459.81]|uniref:Retrotransposon gag domain-containing protein n=1 Tax=Lepidopterella palustris CBS 459.81 TaxID=1314670 RepID=A0A8E2EDC1_9PEZI|nr:hypothetical protein K432DRAFT_424726 [Lepidopterella palustris CBS 459.81]